VRAPGGQVRRERSRPGDTSRKIRQNLSNLFARQYGSIIAGRQHRKPGDRVRYDLRLVRRPFLRRKHYTSLIDRCIDQIARTNAQLPSERSRKNDLAFGRYPRLHGKTILPPPMFHCNKPVHKQFLTPTPVQRYLLATRERRMIQPMKSDSCSYHSTDQREVTEA